MNPWVVGGASHGSSGPGLWTRVAGGEAVREDLVEDRVANPGRRVDAHQPRGSAAPVDAPGRSSRERRVESSRRCPGWPWRRRPPDDGQQQPDGLLALAPDRLVDGRQRRVDVLGEVDVIEADDADVAGDRQAQVAQRRASRRSPSRRSSPGRPSAGARRPRPAQGRGAALDAGRADDDPVVGDHGTGGRRTPRDSRAAAGP